MVRILYTTLSIIPCTTLYTALEHALHTKSIALTAAADSKTATLASLSTTVSQYSSRLHAQRRFDSSLITLQGKRSRTTLRATPPRNGRQTLLHY
ncbi:hypothetical protein Y032_0557g3387 [Ancylostoma ceylanicum]|uniref:Uncharacterized protein n=1 Tax=Ancylostoma ceylanicum TaxID=53326 RepID=A0A016WQ22_9BILA|nr:hypothetical protein Y032_0557g3387 [Ancylostoma ceylanicum]